jgi:site-specific DNA recombinase
MKHNKVGIWVRVSTMMQVQGDSPEHHEQRARNHAELKGFEVAEIYLLEAVSGKSVLHHPEAKRMMADIKRGHIGGLIFSKIARLARNTKELLEIAEVFEEHNAGLISLDDAIDTSTAIGKLSYTIIGAMAEWEREEISSRVSASVPIRAKLGKSLGGQAPFGYAWDNKKLIINEEEATIRRLMYELFLKHKRKRTVARLLNEKGYKTRKGANFSGTTITRLLEDPIAKGMRLVNYTTVRKGKKETKDESDWVYHKAPAIINERTWTNVQNILKEQAQPSKRPLKQDLHLFTGFAKCSCGRKMYRTARTKKYICHGCGTKIPDDVLESIFQEQLHTFSISEDSAREILEQGSTQHGENQQLLSIIDSKIETQQKHIRSLFTLHEQGQLETEDFKTHYKEPKETLDALKEERRALEEKIHAFNHSSGNTKLALSLIQDVYGKWNTLEKTDKRNIIESMIEDIIIDSDSVEINIKQLNPLFL